MAAGATLPDEQSKKGALNATKTHEATILEEGFPERSPTNPQKKPVSGLQHERRNPPLMACYHPISVGVPKPALRKGGPKRWVEQTVPCGNCLGCRANQARDWSIRILHESQIHLYSWFLTLTYSDENIPENGSLYPEDLRGFFKTLRKQHEPEKLSYFACGEYGGETSRPHYHSVLFNHPLLDRIPHSRSSSTPLWRSKTLESAWPYGHSEFSTVTPGSASYVAGYVRKKIGKKAHPNDYNRVNEETGEIVEIRPEFSRMSLRPAIGKRWIEKYWSEVYPKDFVVREGKEYPPPRYYDKWMDLNHPKMMADVRYERDKKATYLAPEKLEAKEKIHKARSELYESRGKI